MGWSFQWFSSADNTFNYNFGVPFTLEHQDKPMFNYGRGIDLLNGAYNSIDISPLGRNEDPSHTQSWVRRHDEYDNPT